MDWDSEEQQQSSAVAGLCVFLSVIFLVLGRTGWIKEFRSALQIVSIPVHHVIARWQPESREPATASSVSPSTLPLWAVTPESRRAVQVLREENDRLAGLLQLKSGRWPHAVAARVIGRDPQRWFQEIVIDKGSADGLEMESAVVAVADGREGLVGRVVELMDHTAKVLLVHDSLSAIAARLVGSASEDGVVEGTNGHQLILKYIDRNSPIKLGDAVVSAGLGDVVPPEILIGHVEEIALDPRQLFLQARLRPAVNTNRLRIVLVLVQRRER